MIEGIGNIITNLSGVGTLNIPAGKSKGNIAYNRPLISGQVTQFNDFDEVGLRLAGRLTYNAPEYPEQFAQLDESLADPYSVLKENNTFGDLRRNTDSIGNNPPGNFEVVDHVTGLVIYPYLAQGNWADTIATIETWNDPQGDPRFWWRMPTFLEGQSIFRYEVGSGNGTPFWTCNTNMANTTQATVVYYTNGHTGQQTKTTNAGLIAIRAYADGEGITAENTNQQYNLP